MANINVGDKGKIKIKWNVNSLDYSPEKKLDIQHLAARKYNCDPKQVVVEVSYLTKERQENTEAIAAETINSIKDPVFQQHLMKRYLEEYGYDSSSYDFEAIKTIDSMVNNVIDSSIYTKASVFNFKKVWFSNFLSYGLNEEFDFTQCHGLISMYGTPPNQCGKTTFAIDLLDYLLHGKSETGKINKYEDVFNTQLPNENESRVKGEIVVDGKTYIIERIVTRTKRQPKNEVHFWEIRGEVNEELTAAEREALIVNLEGKSTIDTSQAISDLVGNEKDYLQVAVADAENLSALISLKDTDRGKLLTRWLGLNVVAEKAEKAKELYSSVKEGFLNGFSKEQLKNENDTLAHEIEENAGEIKYIREIADASSIKIKQLEEEKDRLIMTKTHIDSDLDKYDITTLSEQRKNIIDKGIKKKEERTRKENELAEVKNVTFDKEALENNRNLESQYKALIISHTQNIKKYTAEIERNKTSEYCQYCGAKLTSVNHDHIEKINNELQNTIKTLESELETYNGYMATINSNIKILQECQEAYNRKNLLEVAIQAIDSELNSLRIQATDIKNIMNRLEANKQAIANNNLIDAQINIVKANILQETNKVNSIAIQIANLNKDIEKMTADINRNNGYIVKMEKDEITKRNWSIYNTLVGKDGINKMVLKEILPKINVEINHLLEDVCDFNVEVTVNDQNDTSFYIIKDGSRRNLTSGSGFEQTVAALALRVILANLCTCVKPSFLVLDEVFYGVAKENYGKMKVFIDRIKQHYSFILQITHIPEIQAWGDQQIIIERENGISHINPVAEIIK